MTIWLVFQNPVTYIGDNIAIMRIIEPSTTVMSMMTSLLNIMAAAMTHK